MADGPKPTLEIVVIPPLLDIAGVVLFVGYVGLGPRVCWHEDYDTNYHRGRIFIVTTTCCRPNTQLVVEWYANGRAGWRGALPESYAMPHYTVEVGHCPNPR